MKNSSGIHELRKCKKESVQRNNANIIYKYLECNSKNIEGDK